MENLKIKRILRNTGGELVSADALLNVEYNPQNKMPNVNVAGQKKYLPFVNRYMSIA